MRQQVPNPAERESIDTVFMIVASLVDGTQSVWVRRYNFHKLTQRPTQTVRQYYSEIVMNVTLARAIVTLVHHVQ